MRNLFPTLAAALEYLSRQDPSFTARQVQEWGCQWWEVMIGGENGTAI
jgi:hypothetical protein